MRCLVSAAFLLVSVSCLPNSEFVCDDQDECSGGLCADVGYCIFPDTGCETGFRFSDYAGQDLAGECGSPFGFLNADNGHWYAVRDEDEEWLQAEQQCQQLWLDGGHLADVTSQAENQFVTGLLDSSSYWLGGSDLAQAGVWRWSTGALFEFTNWQPNSPSTDSCLAISGPDGRWSDEDCTDDQEYVCEWP